MKATKDSSVARPERDGVTIARRFNAGLHAKKFESRRDDRVRAFCSAVPAGLDTLTQTPGIEMPGYSQLFLRNTATPPKLDKCDD